MTKSQRIQLSEFIAQHAKKKFTKPGRIWVVVTDKEQHEIGRIHMAGRELKKLDQTQIKHFKINGGTSLVVAFIDTLGSNTSVEIKLED